MLKFIMYSWNLTHSWRNSQNELTQTYRPNFSKKGYVYKKNKKTLKWFWIYGVFGMKFQIARMDCKNTIHSFLPNLTLTWLSYLSSKSIQRNQVGLKPLKRELLRKVSNEFSIVWVTMLYFSLWFKLSGCQTKVYVSKMDF